jgi:hypothetical protein
VVGVQYAHTSKGRKMARKLSTHRVLQVAEIADRAPHERVRAYICAIRAEGIGNRSAAAYFTRRAQQWERIRIAADRQLMADVDARRAT